MLANLYTEILRDELLKPLKYYDHQIEDVYFQQDNNPKYISKLIGQEEVLGQWFQSSYMPGTVSGS